MRRVNLQRKEVEWRLADRLAGLAHKILLVACWLDNRGFTEDLHNHYSVDCHRDYPVTVEAARFPQERPRDAV